MSSEYQIGHEGSSLPWSARARGVAGPVARRGRGTAPRTTAAKYHARPERGRNHKLSREGSGRRASGGDGEQPDPDSPARHAGGPGVRPWIRRLPSINGRASSAFASNREMIGHYLGEFQPARPSNTDRLVSGRRGPRSSYRLAQIMGISYSVDADPDTTAESDAPGASDEPQAQQRPSPARSRVWRPTTLSRISTRVIEGERSVPLQSPTTRASATGRISRAGTPAASPEKASKAFQDLLSRTPSARRPPGSSTAPRWRSCVAAAHKVGESPGRKPRAMGGLGLGTRCRSTSNSSWQNREGEE